MAGAKKAWARTALGSLVLILLCGTPTYGTIWISPEEIRALPMSGTAWNNVKSKADSSCGTPALSNQDDPANVCVMAKALVYVRTGDERYRTDVINAIAAAQGTEHGSAGTALSLGRELGAYVVAAELVGLPPDQDATFRSWLSGVRTTSLPGGPANLIICHEDRPNNWGTHCGFSRMAADLYLGDTQDFNQAVSVFKGWLGDRAAYAGFSYGDLSWQCDSSRPVGINPKGCTKSGHSIDGVLPDDQRRAGGFTWPPPQENYVYEALQGALAQAVILDRQGYDVWNWQDKALLRAFQWLQTQASFPAAGDDNWQPWIVNHFYGTSFSAPSPTQAGKNVGWTDWTFAGTAAPPPACPRCSNGVQDCGETGVDCGGSCAACMAIRCS